MLLYIYTQQKAECQVIVSLVYCDAEDVMGAWPGVTIPGWRQCEGCHHVMPCCPDGDKTTMCQLVPAIGPHCSGGWVKWFLLDNGNIIDSTQTNFAAF